MKEEGYEMISRDDLFRIRKNKLLIEIQSAKRIICDSSAKFRSVGAMEQWNFDWRMGIFLSNIPTRQSVLSKACFGAARMNAPTLPDQ